MGNAFLLLYIQFINLHRLGPRDTKFENDNKEIKNILNYLNDTSDAFLLYL